MITNEKLTQMQAFVVEKTRRNAVVFGDRLPSYTESDGTYQFVEDGGWVGGFWPGMNWLCYEMTGDSIFRDNARAGYCRLHNRLHQKKESLDHDVGFLFIPSALADYKLTGNTDCLQDVQLAARELMKRYNHKGHFIQAWPVWVPGDEFCENNRGRIIVDCMYNLPLLFWTAKNCGEEQANEIAKEHAYTCALRQIREDYSSYHTFVFDPDTGKPRFGQTCQGYADESCWSRGEAWVIGGFAYAYAYTGDPSFLRISEGAADYFVSHLEPDYVPKWDFCFQGNAAQELDTSAAAIAASGMLELSRHLKDKDRAAYFRHMAEKIAESLFDNYSTKDLPEHQGLILHACGNKPENSPDTDAAIIYGDYYFVELVAKLSGKTKVYWL